SDPCRTQLYRGRPFFGLSVRLKPVRHEPTSTTSTGWILKWDATSWRSEKYSSSVRATGDPVRMCLWITSFEGRLKSAWNALSLSPYSGSSCAIWAPLTMTVVGSGARAHWKAMPAHNMLVAIYARIGWCGRDQDGGRTSSPLQRSEAVNETLQPGHAA